MYEEQDAYIAAYLVLFLCAGGCVVDRPSGDADDDGVGEVDERGREQVESRIRTSIEDTRLGRRLSLSLKLRLRLLSKRNLEASNNCGGETVGVALHTLDGDLGHRRSSHAGQG